MNKIINMLSDGFWDWMTCKGRLNAYEYQLQILGYILYTPVMIYCVVMGGLALTKYHYPWWMTLEWIGTVIIFIIAMSGCIGSIINYRNFKRRKQDEAARRKRIN